MVLTPTDRRNRRPYSPAVIKGTAVVLLMLGTLFILGTGAMMFATDSTTGGSNCGSIINPSSEDIDPYDFGAAELCESARRDRTIYATALGVGGLICLAFGGWLLKGTLSPTRPMEG